MVPPGGHEQAGRDVVTLSGRVLTARSSSRDEAPLITCEVVGRDGTVTALFRGRHTVPGLVPGAQVRLRGRVGDRDGHPVMNSPALELIDDGDPGARPINPPES